MSSQGQWPPPQDVPEFAEAWSRGWVRPVPVSAPQEISRTSARSLGIRIALAAAALVALFTFSLTTGSSPFVAASGIALLVTVLAGMRAFGERLLEELTHGYASTTFTNGTFWLSDNRWIAWDFDAVWKRSGDEWVPPTPTGTAPPGLYPSPVEQGRWMVWSGLAWFGRHHAPPRQVSGV